LRIILGKFWSGQKFWGRGAGRPKEDARGEKDVSYPRGSMERERVVVPERFGNNFEKIRLSMVRERRGDVFGGVTVRFAWSRP